MAAAEEASRLYRIYLHLIADIWGRILVRPMRHLRFAACLLLAIWLPACHRAQGQIVKLPSGHEIRVLSVGTMHFSAGKPAWILKYETKTPINNVPELRKEAKEIWEQYKSEVERTGRDGAILSANEPSSGTFISYGRGYNFIVTKQSDGTWKMLER